MTAIWLTVAGVVVLTGAAVAGFAWLCAFLPGPDHEDERR